MLILRCKVFRTFKQKELLMRYVPAACMAIGICGVVGYALYLTKNPNCLWALFFLLLTQCVWPNESKEKKK